MAVVTLLVASFRTNASCKYEQDGGLRNIDNVVSLGYLIVGDTKTLEWNKQLKREYQATRYQNFNNKRFAALSDLSANLTGEMLSVFTNGSTFGGELVYPDELVTAYIVGAAAPGIIDATLNIASVRNM